jgi:plasmid stabilization system protein ParE
MQLRWTLQAAEDLAAIKAFIERDSPTYARRVVEELYDAAAGIPAFPDSGRMVPERGDPEIREVLRPPYRIIYRRRADVIQILTVHHSARLLPRDPSLGAG